MNSIPLIIGNVAQLMHHAEASAANFRWSSPDEPAMERVAELYEAQAQAYQMVLGILSVYTPVVMADNPYWVEELVAWAKTPI